MKSIFYIKEEYFKILEDIYEGEGEVTQEIQDRLNINKEELQEKSLNYAYIIKEIENNNKNIDFEISRLRELKKSNDKKINKLKETVVNAMTIYESQRIESPLIKIYIRPSEQVSIVDETELQDKFFNEKVSRTIDKMAIKEAIKSGENIKGATIITNLNLQIK